MKSILTAALLAVSISASAIPSDEAVTTSPLIDMFVRTASCTAVIIGAEVGPDGGDEEQRTLQLAGIFYEATAQNIAEEIIKTVPGWEKQQYVSMFNAVVEALREQPQPVIQELGMACVGAFEIHMDRHSNEIEL